MRNPSIVCDNLIDPGDASANGLRNCAHSSASIQPVLAPVKRPSIDRDGLTIVRSPDQFVEHAKFHPDGAVGHQRMLNGTVEDASYRAARSKFTAGVSRRANA